MWSTTPVFQIVLQIEVRMASSPSWTNSAGMLSTTVDFSIFCVLTAESSSYRRMGDDVQTVSVDSQVLLGVHQSADGRGFDFHVR